MKFLAVVTPPPDIYHKHHQVDMTQYSLKVGLNKFGERSGGLSRKEFLKLHMMDIFCPADIKNNTKQEENNIIYDFLNEKMDRPIKGMECSDNRKHREKTNKEDTMYPTVIL